MDEGFDSLLQFWLDTYFKIKTENQNHQHLTKSNLVTRYWPLTTRFCTQRICNKILEPTWIVFVIIESRRTELSSAYYIFYFNLTQKITPNRKIDWSMLLHFDFFPIGNVLKNLNKIEWASGENQITHAEERLSFIFLIKIKSVRCTHMKLWLLKVGATQL